MLFVSTFLCSAFLSLKFFLFSSSFLFLICIINAQQLEFETISQENDSIPDGNIFIVPWIWALDQPGFIKRAAYPCTNMNSRLTYVPQTINIPFSSLDIFRDLLVLLTLQRWGLLMFTRTHEDDLSSFLMKSK